MQFQSYAEKGNLQLEESYRLLKKKNDKGNKKGIDYSEF